MGWRSVGPDQGRLSVQFFFTVDAYVWASSRRPGMGSFPGKGTSLTHQVHVPTLIGIQNIRFLDATGLVRNRSIGDPLAHQRYAVINEGLDMIAPTVRRFPAGARHSSSRLALEDRHPRYSGRTNWRTRSRSTASSQLFQPPPQPESLLP